MPRSEDGGGRGGVVGTGCLVVCCVAGGGLFGVGAAVVGRVVLGVAGKG